MSSTRVRLAQPIGDTTHAMSDAIGHPSRARPHTSDASLRPRSTDDPRIPRTVYSFGALGAGYFGNLVLRGDGLIGHYRHPNETTFRLLDDAVAFHDADGALTSTLEFLAGGNLFFSRRAGLYLLPVLEMSAPEHAPEPPYRPDAALLFNTIPKSGTYLLEAAAARAGYLPTRLHLSAHVCDDYRGLTDAEMHRAPERQRIPVPASVVAHVLRPGEVVVGHIDHPGQLDGMAQAGLRIVHCVRDLRQVLVSLYRFKRQVVRPISPADTVWRALGEVEGLLGFLGCFADRDVALVARTASCILSRREPRLRFEDLTGAPPDLLRAQLTRWDDTAAQALVDGIVAARGLPTSTLLAPARTEVWSAAAERFFEEVGLGRLNRELGYPDPAG